MPTRATCIHGTPLSRPCKHCDAPLTPRTVHVTIPAPRIIAPVVSVAPPAPKRRGPWTARRCSPTCNGWAVISGTVQRCDACDRWRSDAGACDHVERAHNALAQALRIALYDLDQAMAADPGWRPRSLTQARAALKLATGEA